MRAPTPLIDVSLAALAESSCDWSMYTFDQEIKVLDLLFDLIDQTAIQSLY